MLARKSITQIYTTKRIFKLSSLKEKRRWRVPSHGIPRKGGEEIGKPAFQNAIERKPPSSMQYFTHAEKRICLRKKDLLPLPEREKNRFVTKDNATISLKKKSEKRRQTVSPKSAGENQPTLALLTRE